MNLSYWEIKSWLSNIDYTIVGSGIVGLNCALQLKQQFPKASILILERGRLPQGASTKNAGFACFGSMSEILDDLQSHTEEEVLQLIHKRIDGLNLLRQNLSDQSIDYQQLGGYELFNKHDTQLYESCLSQQETINEFLWPNFIAPIFQVKSAPFGFENIQKQVFFNPFEAQLDTGKMMEALLFKAHQAGIKILNNVEVHGYSELHTGVSLQTSVCSFKTNKLFIATNGFSSQLIDEPVKPARAQVLITKPIENLKIAGTFHIDRGYSYFRNIHNRILLGGGRNIDFKGEQTTDVAYTKSIQNHLENLLEKTILPHTNFEIESRWTGIMGVGSQKKAIVKQLSNNVFCGVRLGGMGVAIGSIIGKELAQLLD
ncbi:NAD(P)/FAD-dependent oxidoreductase [Bizionia sp. KMM 8389]